MIQAEANADEPARRSASLAVRGVSADFLKMR
jgi:hypothetical protein